MVSLAKTSGTERGKNLLVLDSGGNQALGWALARFHEGRSILINVDGALPGELLAVPSGTEKGIAAPGTGSRWAVLVHHFEGWPSDAPYMPAAGWTPSAPPGAPAPQTVPASWSPAPAGGEGPAIEPPPFPMPSGPPPGMPSLPSLPSVPSMPSVPGGPGAATMPLPPGDPLAGVPEPLRSQVLNAINDPMVSPAALRALADQLRPAFPQVAAMLEQAAMAKEASEKARAASEGRLFTIRGSGGIALDLPTTVAKHYTGDPGRWKEILGSNPELKPKPAPDGSGATWVDGWNVGKVVLLPAAWGNLIAKGLPPALAMPKKSNKQQPSVIEAAKRELRARGLAV